MKLYTIGQNFEFTFNTHNSSGVASDADDTPTYSVYAANVDSAIASGSASKKDDTNTTGYYKVTSEITSGTYTEGNIYDVRVTVLMEGISSSAIVGSFAVLPTAAWDSLFTDSGLSNTLLNSIIEGSYTLQDITRLIASALLGKVSGAGSGTPTFRDLADTKNRITSTTDSSGNRLSVTLDST